MSVTSCETMSETGFVGTYYTAYLVEVLPADGAPSWLVRRRFRSALSGRLAFFLPLLPLLLPLLLLPHIQLPLFFVFISSRSSFPIFCLLLLEGFSMFSSSCSFRVAGPYSTLGL